MHLYLVQHAVAKPKQEDPDRPITDQGREEVEKVASYLGKINGVQAKNVYHSGKLRAKQTAEILSKHMNIDKGIDEQDGLKAMDDPNIWKDRLLEMKDDVILVGHLPHLSKLASALLCDDQENEPIAFRNGGVVCLSQEEDNNWKLKWVFTPELVSD